MLIRSGVREKLVMLKRGGIGTEGKFLRRGVGSQACAGAFGRRRDSFSILIGQKMCINTFGLEVLMMGK